MLEREKSLIIISTTISICIMLLTGIDKNQEKKVIENYENIKNNIQVNIDKPKDESTTRKTLYNLDEGRVSNTSENIKGSVTVKEPKKSTEEKKNESSNVLDNNKFQSDALQMPEGNLKKDDDTEKIVAVFKVNREDIFSELSILDKEKLLLISTKLEASDYKKISKLLEKDVDGQGVLSSLKILKARLSKNDYSKIKKIFNKFINMDLVDN